MSGHEESTSDEAEQIRSIVGQAHQFLVEIHLHHLLDRVADMHQLKKVHQWSDSAFRVLLVLGRSPCLDLRSSPVSDSVPEGLGISSQSCSSRQIAIVKQPLNSPCEPWRDMALTKTLQKSHSDFFNLIPHTMSIIPRIFRERLYPFQAVAVNVHELQSRIEAEQQLQSRELGWSARRRGVCCTW